MCSVVAAVHVRVLVVAACFSAANSQFMFWGASREVKRSPEQGGAYHQELGFSDYLEITNYVNGVRSIVLTYSDQVDSIQITYLLSNKSLYKAPTHGSVKNINPPVEIKLAPGEFVHKIEGESNGVHIDQLSITTFRPKKFVMKKYGPFGGRGNTSFSSEGYVVCFYGSAGEALNTIGFFQLDPIKRSSLSGGSGKLLTFDENPDTEFFPPIVKINKLFVYHDKVIRSIRAQYKLMDGTTRMGRKYGGNGGRLNVISYDSDDKIIGLEGSAESDRICHFTFVSQKKDYSKIYNGPYGWSCPNAFSLTGNIFGLFGVADNTIVGFGVYYV